MPELTMPKLSDSMEEGTIVSWLVADGSEVALGTEVAEIETDKATMAFQSEFSGVLHIIAGAGDTLAVGTPIATILAAGETRPPAGSSAVAAPVWATPNATAVSSPGRTGKPRADPQEARRVSASPVARRMARELRVELATLTGTGPSGRVTKRDVLRVAESGIDGEAAPANGRSTQPPETARAQRPPPAGPAHAPAPAEGGAKGAVDTAELTRVQATIARRMADAKANQPEFTLEVNTDMDRAVAMRAEIKQLGVDHVPSFNDFVVRACALALRAHPHANGAFRNGRFERYERVNIGVAVAVPGGLLVPIVFDADRRTLGDIAAETRRLAAAARDGTLAPAELSGGTFSVSNLGMFGITRFTAVLNPPQAAILAVGALEQSPVVREGAVVSGHRMPMTLTCDHRILYGADAAQFLAEIRANLETPLRLAL